MADIEDSLNVRVEPDAEADLAGKLEKGDRATVLEIGEEWTKIESGELVGYVKNEYCIYGMEALAYAKANCDTIATTMTEGLRIRAEMNTSSNEKAIITRLITHSLRLVCRSVFSRIKKFFINGRPSSAFWICQYCR